MRQLLGESEQTLALRRAKRFPHSQHLEFVGNLSPPIVPYRCEHFHLCLIFLKKSTYSRQVLHCQFDRPSSKLDYHAWILTRIPWLQAICRSRVPSSLLCRSRAHHFPSIIRGAPP